MRDGFAEYHPIVNMCYYVAVMGTAMFVMHPIFLLISLIAAVSYEIYLKKEKGIKFVGMLIPIFMIMSLINPLFSHQGMTLICYLPTGNPLTLESVLFGLASGIMIVTVIIWFATFNAVMTGDKILCVVGEISPAVGMLLSMILRFVPKFENQAKKVMKANEAIEGAVIDTEYENKIKVSKKSNNKKSKLMQGMKSFGIMATWSLENSVVTADSMKARGYGSGKRTSFSVYRFEIRDGILLGIIAMLSAWNIGLILAKEIRCEYYPTFEMTGSNGILHWFIYYGPQLILCFLPMIINIMEDIRWHRLKSKI